MKESNFERVRFEMVENQLMRRGIRDKRTIEAFMKVPRHKFVPHDLLDIAYTDQPLPIGQGQTISQPYMVALMTELLQLKGDERVLELGTGSGYQAAILAELSHFVYSIERIATLAERAKKLLTELGYKNFEIKVGDGTLGWEEKAPFNAIIVTAGAPSIPESLINQLAPNGRIVIPVGNCYSQELILGIKRGDGLKKRTITGCIFVPLIGKHGWEEKP